MQLAREQFQAGIKERLAPVIADLLTQPDFTKLLLEAVMLNIPKAAAQAAQSIMYGAVQIATDSINQTLPDQLRNAVMDSLSRR